MKSQIGKNKGFYYYLAWCRCKTVTNGSGKPKNLRNQIRFILKIVIAFYRQFDSYSEEGWLCAVQSCRCAAASCPPGEYSSSPSWASSSTSTVSPSSRTSVSMRSAVGLAYRLGVTGSGSIVPDPIRNHIITVVSPSSRKSVSMRLAVGLAYWFVVMPWKHCSGSDP